MAYCVGAQTRILFWRYLHLITSCFYIGTVGCVQHNENVYVSGISNACGGAAEQIRASSGVITSPGWPLGYPSRINCSWNIRANPGEIITISFQDFDIQSSHRCGSDWLSIGTYKNADGYRACGSSIPAPYISSQDHVWIRFHSDDSLTAKGFRLSYITGKTEEISCNSDQFHCANGKCVPDGWKCNGMDECGDGSDEELCARPDPSASFPFQPCARDQFPCLSRYTRAYTCLPESLRCDGSIDCQDLGDEVDCDAAACGELLRTFYGTFSSPNYPDFYPPGSNCTWLIDTGDHRRVVLRFADFKLDGTGYGDYVKVYDGLEEDPRRLLRVLTAFDARAPVAVVSSSGQLRVRFRADKVNAARGFNATYQRCDGYWHCPNGRDEANCSACQPDEFPCSRGGGAACYPRSDRCNYQNRCPNGSDEKNCFSCQPGNFHCRNNRCVFESWVCDAQDDCGDGSDEESCPVAVPTRVITAAVIGSLVCGLLLVIALGCTCKLYSLRMFERRSFETQLSRVEAELLRREAPPSYGQLIAQGLIPPVEDFPACSANQVSVLENLRQAVRSQLGFASIRLPGSGRHRNLWRRLLNFTRSRCRGSLALVSADAEEGVGGGPGAREPEPHRGLLPLDSDDTDADGNRRDVPGAAGGPVTALTQKTPPTSAVEAITAASRESPAAGGGEGGVPETQPTGRGQLTGALSRVTRGLRWVRASLGRPGASTTAAAAASSQSHSPSGTSTRTARAGRTRTTWSCSSLPPTATRTSTPAPAGGGPGPPSPAVGPARPAETGRASTAAWCTPPRSLTPAWRLRLERRPATTSRCCPARLRASSRAHRSSPKLAKARPPSPELPVSIFISSAGFSCFKIEILTQHPVFSIAGICMPPSMKNPQVQNLGGCWVAHLVKALFEFGFLKPGSCQCRLWPVAREGDAKLALTSPREGRVPVGQDQTGGHPQSVGWPNVPLLVCLSPIHVSTSTNCSVARSGG
ncbi:hypothetical protein ANANG_G00014900 [Anguilla anguilla]|uniref:CUB domain-containing protein n=1 Tax=Anguilla anguilla TaxID=7936 RepID=A0A9D3N0I6_ANGAN|nr:hypothetical protein ANANG_G00014900 [Anguilla anguilla]